MLVNTWHHSTSKKHGLFLGHDSRSGPFATSINIIVRIVERREFCRIFAKCVGAFYSANQT